MANQSTDHPERRGHGTRDKVARARLLRREATAAETILWKLLRGKQLGVRVRRQHPLLGYIVDFYVPVTRLVIELDGPVHDDAEARRNDAQRDAVLRREGYATLRFTNTEVLASPAAILRRIAAALRPLTLPDAPQPDAST